MGRTIDADSHFMEPLDLWPRYIDPAYRSRCLELTYDERAGLQVKWCTTTTSAATGIGAGHTCAMERSASETFARNVWVCADPTERTLPYTLELVGDDKFFLGSDFPHAEGFTDPMGKARDLLAKLPPASVDRVLGENAVSFFRV